MDAGQDKFTAALLTVGLIIWSLGLVTGATIYKIFG